MFIIVIPSTSVFSIPDCFLGDEDAMACHRSELLMSMATPCTLLLVYGARFERGIFRAFGFVA